MILLFILAIVVISSIVRLITFPFRYGYRRGPFFGYGNNGYNNPYGGGYGYPRYGYRRRHGIGHFLLILLVLVFFSHLFGGHHHYHGGF